MTPAVLVPIYVSEAPDEDFFAQLSHLRRLLAGTAEILEPRRLGAPLPEADAAVVPQLLGAAYRQVDLFRSIHLPLLLITTEFATVSMWDWEIRRLPARRRRPDAGPDEPRGGEGHLPCPRGEARPAQREVPRLPGQPRRPGPSRPSSSASTGGRTSARSGCSTGSASGSSAGHGQRSAPRQRRSQTARPMPSGSSGAPACRSGPSRSRRCGRALKLYCVLKRDLDADPGDPRDGDQLPERVAFLGHDALPRVEHALRGGAADLGVRGRHGLDDDRSTS